MKKTINANIGGIEFTLNEDAYNALEAYLENLKKYFRETEGTDDIMEDIEARIAEILQERMAKSAIVEMKDVEAVQATIGFPEDFETPESEEEATDEKTTGGTVYLGKRFFRNPDDKMLGGVCSGISAYFGIDPIWLRLAFVIGTIFYGTGFWIYIVLWIVIPEAKTTTEKMQMRGERVNIDNIKRTVQDEVSNVGERVKGFAEEAREWSGKKSTTDPIRNFFNALGDLIRAIAKGIGKVFLVVILLLAVVLLGALVISIASGTAVMTFSIPFMQEYIFTQPWHVWLVLVGAVLIVLVPLVWIFIRLFFNQNMPKKARHAVNATTIIIWIAAIWMIIPVGINLGLDFRTRGAVSSTSDMTIAPDTLFVSIAQANSLYYDWNGYLNKEQGRIKLHTNRFDVMDDTLVLNDIEIRRLSTNDTNFSIKTQFIARGKTRSVAKDRAARINYQYALNGSKLVFDPYFTLGGAPFRAQKVEVFVFVPEGKAAVMKIR